VLDTSPFEFNAIFLPNLPPMRLRTTAALVLTGILPLAACTDRAAAPTAVAEPADASFSRSKGQPSVQFIAEREPSVLVNVGGVVVSNSGYGSGMALKPGSARNFYLLTDRGPNYDGPGSPAPKRFPDPSFAPRIYPAHIAGNTLQLGAPIILKGSNGTPMSGLPVPAGACGNTGEVGQKVNGDPLAPDPLGLDPEGIVAMPDGTFWLSDEYGPFMVQFDANGRELRRFSPCGGGLPNVYALRRPNRGMEGLTITPDGQWLVGIMQSPLRNRLSTANNTIVDNSLVTRILFKHLTNGTTREYIYPLDRSGLQGNSEILALSSTRFLVIERDGTFLFGTPTATLKRIYEVDISGATDVSLIGGDKQPFVANGTKTLEEATLAELAAADIKVGVKTLRVDLLALGYPHDKPEGLALAPGGFLFVINDDDFGIVSQGGVLGQKFLPPSSTVADKPALWQIKLP
jgi:hypothetical protein